MMTEAKGFKMPFVKWTFWCSSEEGITSLSLCERDVIWAAESLCIKGRKGCSSL